uniref:Uncharacterized protein n=1 Tax=Cacopsylla melanoneura TaxID=428564 RepID=A0A8D8W815_9HEMI
MEKFNEYHYWDKDYEEEEEISFDSNVNVQLTKLLQEFPKDVVKKAFEEIDSIYQITDPNTAYNHLVKIIQSNFVSVKKRRKCLFLQYLEASASKLGLLYHYTNINSPDSTVLFYLK